MSDLLAHLVARTLTSAPVIRPRLEPLFSTALAIDEQAVEVIARPVPPPSNEMVVETKASSGPRRTTVEPATTMSVPRIQDREIVSDRKHQTNLTLPPQRNEKKFVQPPAPGAREHATKREAEAVVAPPSRERVKTSRHFTPAIKPASIRFEKEEPPSAAAPIVRVTIGRIEVRAGSAAAPTPRKAARPAGPALTLDAYLNSRKGGAR